MTSIISALFGRLRHAPLPPDRRARPVRVPRLDHGGLGPGRRRLPLVLRRLRAPPRGRRSRVQRRHGGSARDPHEPQLARPLRAARVREERLRPADHRRRRPAADAGAAEPARVAGQGPWRHGPRPLSPVRRPHRRHLRRCRRHPGAPQPARDADVGEGAGNPAGEADVRAASRRHLDGRLAALPYRQSAGVHGAQPRLPVRQPGAVRAADAADVPVAGERGGGRAGNDDPRRPAPRRHRGRSRPFRRRGREDRARGARRLRRAAGVRARLLHLPRHLRPGRQRRRHGASQQHGPHRAGGPRAGRAAAARHGGARVLPRLERRAHPAQIARAVQLRRRQRVLASCGSPKASRSTTAAC